VNAPARGSTKGELAKFSTLPPTSRSRIPSLT
jgi:hypothetical protein